MGRTEDLLLLESAGQLPADMQKDLDTLRAAGVIPASGSQSDGASITKTAEPVYKRPDDRLGLTVPKNLISPPTSIDETLSRMGEFGSAVASTAAKSALPLAGGMAGFAVGAASPLPGGAIMGEMAGSMGGEYLNQLIGITEQDKTQLVLAGGAPMVGRAISSIARGGMGSFLKSFGGRQNVADAAGEIMRKRLAPPTPAEDLYDIAGTVNAYIPTPKTGQKIAEILKGEKDINTEVSKQIKAAVGQQAATFPDGAITQIIPGQDIAKVIKDLRLEATNAYKTQNTRLGHAINDMRGALIEDTVDAGVPEFAAAGNAARREISIDKLAGILHKANPVSEFEKAMTNKNDRLFKGTFSAAEIADIKNVLNKMSTVPPSGGSGVVGRSVLGTVGSMLFSDPTLKAIGATTGAFLPDIAAKLLSTGWGRRALEKNLMGQPLDNATMAKIATIVRGDYADTGSVKDAVTMMLQKRDMPIENKLKAAMLGAQGGGMSGILPLAPQ